MRTLFLILFMLPLFVLSQGKEPIGLAGENITLRKAFEEIRLSESDIRPKNGFITIRRFLSDDGQFSTFEVFQIDENYKRTEFNNGKLKEKLERIAITLKDWKRDKDFMEFSLIRLKIKAGRIEEVF